MSDTRDVTVEPEPFDLGMDCENPKKGELKPDPCQRKELCAMIDSFNQIPKEKIKVVRPSPSATIPKAKASKYFSTSPPRLPGQSMEEAYKAHVDAYNTYQDSLTSFRDKFAQDAQKEPFNEAEFKKRYFYDDCRYEQWKNGSDGPPKVPPRSMKPPAHGPAGVNPDHSHDAGLGGPVGDIDGMKWANYKINSSLGRRLGAAAEEERYKPGMKVEAPKCCPAPD